MTARVLAPFGAPRLRGGRSDARPAATSCSPRWTPTGPIPSAGQFYMLAAGRAGAAAAAGPSCRARSPSPMASARTAACGSTSWSRPWGRAPRLLAALEPGDAARAHRPAGPPLLGAARARSRAPPARSSSAAASAIAPIAILAPQSRAAGVPARTLLGFRDEAHSGGLELFGCQEVGLASEDGHAGHRGYVTDLLAGGAQGRRRRERRASTPAARRRCSRRCGRSATERGVAGRARDGGADGLRLRRLLRLRGSARGRGLHAALRRRARGAGGRDRDRARRGSPGIDDVTHRRPLARAPGPERLRHVRRDRRAAGVRRRAARALPVLAPSSRRRSPRSRAPATRRRGSSRPRAG